MSNITATAMRVVFYLVLVCCVWMGCRQRDESNAAVMTQAIVPTTPDSIARHTADSLYMVAERVRKQGDDASSLKLHRQALEIRQRLEPSSVSVAYSLWKTGQLMLSQLQVSEADRNLEAARTLAEIHTLPADTLVLMLLNSSAVKRELNDFASSQTLAIRALGVARDRAKPNTSLISRCYRSLASSYYANQQFDEAIKNFQSAISLANSESDAALLASLHFNVALCYGGLKDFKKELYLLDKAKSILIRSFGESHPLIGSIFLNKGEIYRTTGQLDSALYCFTANLAIRKRLVGEKHLTTAGAKESVGNFFASMGQLDSALAYYHGSLVSAAPSFSNTDVFENPSLSSGELTKDLVPFLVNKATLLERMYQADTMRTDVLEKSFETFLLADSVFNIIRANMTFDDPQLAQLTNGALPYERMLSVAHRLYGIHGGDKYLEQAFGIMERSRAIVLRDALNRAEFYHQVGVSEEIKQRESKVRETRAMLANLLSKALNDTQRDSIAALLFQNDADYKNLQAEIAAANPSYYQVRFGNDVLPLGDLKELMKQKESIWIEFFWGEQDLTVLRVSATDVLLKKVSIDSTLLASVKYLQQQVHYASEASFRKDQLTQYATTAFYLYKVLLEPVLKNHTTQKLVISADGPLGLFPFETLIDEMPAIEDVDYHLPYLVNRFFFSYHFSAMQLMRQHAKARHGSRLLALGYAGSGKGPIRRNAFNDLPGTREEVLAIRDVMTNSANQFLLELEASESAFKTKVRQFDLVHLAIHGVGDTLDAMQSRLVFRSEVDSIDDGQLFTHEMYGLNLEQLDLAVLSACESGVGKRQVGEGAMSIARGFAYAGCPTLVISLWKINDKTAPSIMATFYKNISEEHAVDESLAEAKRWYLESANAVNSHPSSWAAFLIVGETKPLAIETGIWRITLACAIAIALTAGWLMFRRKKVSSK